MTERTASATQERQPWLMVGVLAVLYGFAFMDRSIMTLLVDPIKQDLSLSDVEVSLLMGLAFSAAYSLTNIPAGFLIDRMSRRNIIGATTVIWSGATLLSGFATSFWHMLTARVGVGASEAFLAPAAFSLVRERVAPAAQGRAFSVMGMAPYVGGSLAFIAGAAILHAAGNGAFASWPLIGGAAAWQMVFVVMGLASLLAAALVLVLRPDRSEKLSSAANVGLGLRPALLQLRAQWGAYACLIGFATFSALFQFGVSSWTPALMSRVYGVPLSEVGYLYGYITLACGVGGLLLGGHVMDARTKRGRSFIGLAALSIALSGAGATLMPIAGSAALAWACCAVMGFFAAPTYAVSATMLARITPPELMGRLTAIFLVVQSVIGAGFGPTILAAISQQFFSGPTAIAPATSVFAAVTACGGAALLLMLRAVQTARRTEPAADVIKA